VKHHERNPATLLQIHGTNGPGSYLLDQGTKLALTFRCAAFSELHLQRIHLADNSSSTTNSEGPSRHAL